MSTGPIEIHPYPRNSLLESSQKQYDIGSEQDFPTSTNEFPQPDGPIITQGPCRGHFRQKRPLNTEYYHNLTDSVITDDTYFDHGKVKRNRKNSREPAQILGDQPIPESYAFSRSDMQDSNKSCSRGPCLSSSFLPVFNEDKVSTITLVSETVESIVQSLNHSYSIEGARDSITILINDLSSKLESRMNDILKSQTNSHHKLTDANINKLLNERNDLNFKVDSLMNQLQSERQENVIKDQEINNLQNKLSETNGSLEQLKISFENYLRNQSLLVHKSCGIHERFPPDVY